MSQIRTVEGCADSPPRRSRARQACSVALLLLATLVGCDDRGREEARQEAVIARADAERLKFNLEKAKQEISELKAELNAVRQSRDALQDRIAQIIEDRDDAMKFAAEAQEVVTSLTSRAQGQNNATAALEQEISQLRALVAEQQALIEQLQTDKATPPAEEDVPAEPPDEPVPPDPDGNL